MDRKAEDKVAKSKAEDYLGRLKKTETFSFDFGCGPILFSFSS